LAARRIGVYFFRVKKLWSIFSTLALMAILAAVVVPRIPANAQNAPKNLKVLTPENLHGCDADLSGRARRPETREGCNFCHEADRSLDTKPTKLKAREMIEMVAEINAKFGDGKVHVSCWTCHQGSTKPETARPPTR
jgi:hypothetical protein